MEIAPKIIKIGFGRTDITPAEPVDYSKDHLVLVCRKIQNQWYSTYRHGNYRPYSDPHNISSIYHAEAHERRIRYI